MLNNLNFTWKLEPLIHHMKVSDKFLNWWLSMQIGLQFSKTFKTWCYLNITFKFELCIDHIKVSDKF